MRAQLRRFVLLAAMLAGLAFGTATAPAQDTPSAQPAAVHTSTASVIPNTFGWQNEMVDKLGDVGLGSSIALDSAGYSHIAYYDLTLHQLKYAAWDGIAWTLDTVDSALGDLVQMQPAYPFLPIRTGIAVYGTTVFMVYDALDEATSQRVVRYATGWPGHWKVTTIAPTDSSLVVYAPTIRLDRNVVPHVSYTQFENGTPQSQSIIYAHLDVNDTWVTQSVDTASVDFGVTLITSLALDTNNHPQIAYASATEFTSPLKLAQWTTGHWLTQTVSPSAGWPSLAVDSAGLPHIAYLRPTGMTYANWDGATWHFANFTIPPGNLRAPSLALDTLDRPRIAVWDTPQLTFWRWDGTAWQTEDIPDGSDLPLYIALALDTAGNAHVSYYDGNYQDLHTVTWASDWQTRTVTISGSGPSLAVDTYGRPFVSYNDSSRTVHLANWTPGGSWQYRTVTPNGFYDSLRLQYDVNRQPLPIVSYADVADLAHPHLGFAQWNGTAFVTQTVDSANAVGDWSSLTFNAGASPIIGYYDAGNQRVKLATANGPGGTGWTISTDMAGPPVHNPWLASGGSPVGSRSYIAYVDSSSLVLRLATWDGATWTDELVDGGGADQIAYVSLAVDRATGDPALAYFDLTHTTVKYAFRSGSVWTKVPVDSSPGNVSDLSLALALYSNQYPRIAYTALADNSVRLAWTTVPTSTWTVETVGSFSDLSSASVSSAAQTRDHIAIDRPTPSMVYAFRSATLPYSIYFNPLQPCVDSPPPPMASTGPTLAQVRALAPSALSQVDDLTTLRALRDLFALSPGGRYYINLYYQYAPQAGALALRDPALLWDAYRTLENWLPGFLALSVGQGSRQVISQAMIDQVNDIADRLVTAGSPALGAAINLERGKYNHLQAFVGKTFQQGANLIGVPVDAVYLPIVRR